ncbi:MAG: methyltransferase domain-containing protein, partial [Acidobacteriota bacterium]|nr:methyltransferase domain-containing protein [Acidobacteriota bacterium]
MEFTGERIVPGKVDADLLNEHLCRYRFAQLLVEDKAVLDIGSGVGYGSKILAERASSVVAIDLSEEAVRYAKEQYAGDDIEMVVGDGAGLPLANDSVDVVVSFELIEHLHGQQAHLQEVNRALKPNGVAVISTPNRIFYTQESNQANPFHTREFDFREFHAFLKSVFGSVEIYFQNHIAGLIIGNPTIFQEVTTLLQEEVADMEATANFFVGVCTHGRKHQPQLGNFCLLPGSGNLLRERQQHIQRLEKEVGKLDSALTRLQDEYDQRTNWALQLNRQVKSRDRSLVRLRKEFEDRSHRAEDLSRQVEARDKALGELQAEFESR